MVPPPVRPCAGTGCGSHASSWPSTSRELVARSGHDGARDQAPDRPHPRPDHPAGDAGPRHGERIEVRAGDGTAAHEGARAAVCALVAPAGTAAAGADMRAGGGAQLTQAGCCRLQGRAGSVSPIAVALTRARTRPAAVVRASDRQALRPAALTQQLGQVVPRDGHAPLGRQPRPHPYERPPLPVRASVHGGAECIQVGGRDDARRPADVARAWATLITLVHIAA
jgi:hypothetical protein